jgi:hypothetical protein
MEDEKDVEEVYRERNLLALALAKHGRNVCFCWKVDPENEDWAIVYIDTSKGQISYHVPRSMVELLLGQSEEYRKNKNEPVWDGHSDKEKNIRLQKWIFEG